MAISFASLAGGGKYQRTEIITSTQSWTCPAGVTIAEVFLVGGGGGGGVYDGSSKGGGGGGGGVIQQSLAVTPGTSYTVTIGAGGSGGAKGGNSTFGSLLTSYGGGYGLSNSSGQTQEFVASGGGSNGQNRAGGGGGAFPFTYTQSTTGYGFASNYYPVVQGTVGYNQNSFYANPGINGYGAGGGGGTDQASTEARGGINAGHGARTNVTPIDAAANFGGGGGGCNTQYNPSQGGSGVCIIKYWA